MCDVIHPRMASFYGSQFPAIHISLTLLFLSNLNSGCDRLHGLMRACISEPHDFNALSPLIIFLLFCVSVFVLLILPRGATGWSMTFYSGPLAFS